MISLPWPLVRRAYYLEMDIGLQAFLIRSGRGTIMMPENCKIAVMMLLGRELGFNTIILYTFYHTLRYI